MEEDKKKFTTFNEMMSAIAAENFQNAVAMASGTYKPFDDIDTETLAGHLNAFDRIDLRTISDHDLEYLISVSIASENLINKHILISPTELCRTRNWGDIDHPKDFYTNKKEVWWPDPKIITELGRLNGIGESLLYTSFDGMTPLFEKKFKSGEMFSLFKYRVKPGQELELASIVLDNPKSLDFPGKFSWTEKGIKNWELINGFLRKEFTKEVPVGSEYLYRSTNKIVKAFDFPGCDGFLYPSVASDGNHNIAIKSGSVDRALDFIGLAYIHYIGPNNKKNKIPYSINMSEKWATRLEGDKIIYEPVSPCPLKFPLLTFG